MKPWQKRYFEENVDEYAPLLMGEFAETEEEAREFFKQMCSHSKSYFREDGTRKVLLPPPWDLDAYK